MNDAACPSSDSPLGPCPLCGRPMIAGPSVERHHLTPKAKGGRKTIALHTVCHRMVHKIFDNAYLARLAEDESPWEQLRAHPDMAAFVRWVAKKPADFVDRPRTRGRRPYHRA